MIAILSILSVAFAQDAAVEAPAVEPTHKTYWLVAGTSEYADALDLPSVAGATEDCKLVAEHLLGFGYEPEQVTSLCGTAFIKQAFVRALIATADKVEDGDSFVVFLTGHGGADPASPGQKFWQASDGVFSLSANAEGEDYFTTGIAPDMVVTAIRERVPEGTALLVVLDTARGEEYAGLSLLGPSGRDFKDGTFAVSPENGSSLPGGIRAPLITCLTADRYDPGPGIKPFFFQSCMTSNFADSLAVSGDWYGNDRHLIWFPPSQVREPEALMAVPVPEPVKSRLPKTVRTVGGAVAVAGLATGTATYFLADGIRKDIANGQNMVALKNAGDLERYNALRVVTYASWGVGGLGGAVAGVTVAF